MPEAGRRTVRRGLAILGVAVRAEPRPFAVSLLGAGVYAAMTVAQALVLGKVTDRLVIPAFRAGQTTRAALALAAAVILGTGALKAAGIVGRRVGAGLMQFKLMASYRERIAGQYNRLPLSWHSSHATGSLLSTAGADVEAAFWPIAPLPLSCGAVVMLVLTLAVLAATDLALTAVALVIGPVLALLNWRYGRVISGPATRTQERRADLAAVAHESFDGALMVKTLGREEVEVARFAAASDRLRDELIGYGTMRALFDPLTEALPGVGVLLILAAGCWRLSQGALSEGGLVQFAYLFTLLAFPIRAIGWVLAELPRAVVGWDRIQRVLNATGAVAYGTLDGPVPPGPAAARLDSVSFSYQRGDGLVDGLVLDGVDFDAAPGALVALVGPTGAGKSTIASLLVRLADPAVGAVRLDGRDLRALAPGTVARSVALVFQESFLFDDTLRENITLGEPFSDEDVRRAARLAQADAFIQALPDGYDTVTGEGGTTLSGGQRQRVALARALIRRPRLLILDDATSHVDTTVEAAILAGLREADLGATILLVAYRQATIALADEIVFVADGRVQARGTHTELMATAPAYAALISAYAEEARRRSAAEVAE